MSTLTWLEGNDHAELALVLAVEGWDTLFTTSDDTSGIATAWSGTDWSTVAGVLLPVGAISQRIQLLQPKIEGNDVAFDIVDPDGAYAKLFYGNQSTRVTTYLDGDLDNNDTTATVKDTTAFASSGTIYVNREAIAYTGKTSTTFTGLTRGKYTLWGPSAGGRFGRYHRAVWDTESGRTTAAAVYDYPESPVGRMCGLYLHHKEAGVWSTKANAMLIWAGKIRDWEDSGAGTLTLRAANVVELLNQDVFFEQYRAKAADVLPCNGSVVVYDGVYNEVAEDSFTAGRYRWDEAYENVRKSFNSLYTGSSTSARYSIDLIDYDGEQRIRIWWQGTGASEATVRVGLDWGTWRLLGWPNAYWQPRAKPVFNATGEVHLYPMVRISSTKYELIAPTPPLVSTDPSGTRVGQTFDVVEERGTLQTQPSGTLPFWWQNSSLLLKSGETVIGVTVASSSVLARRYTVRHTTSENFDHEDRAIRLNESSKPAEVRQAWHQQDKAGKNLLRLMLSTGTSGYNDSTYDVLPYGLGLEIPYELIDVESVLGLTAAHDLFLDQATPFSEVLEPILATTNQHVVFKNGKITVTTPGHDATSYRSVIEVTEDTKAEPSELMPVSINEEGVINVVRLTYDDRRDFRNRWESDSDALSAPKDTISAYDAVSAGQYGERRPLVIKANGIMDADDALDGVIEAVMRYYSRPFATIQRSTNYKLINLAPGDLIKITENSLYDPRTDTRGVSGLGAFVLEHTFDLWEGRGTFRAVFLPTHDISRYAKQAPSARVNEGATNAGYDAGNVRLTCKAHEFSRSTDSVDVASFAVNDKVVVRELSPGASPLSWARTVTAVDTGANTIDLNSALTSWDNTKLYIVEFDDYGTVATSQKGNHSYMAQDDGLLSGGDDGDWYAAPVGSPWRDPSTAIDYDQGFVQQWSTDYDVDEPISVHKLHYLEQGLNSQFEHRTRTLWACMPYPENTISASENETLVYGPIWCPLYTSRSTPVNRGVKGKVRASVAGVSGTIEIWATKARPTGASVTAGSFDSNAWGLDVSTTVTFGFSPASNYWGNFTIANPPVAWVGAQAGFWLYATAVGGLASTITFKGIIAVEGDLP